MNSRPSCSCAAIGWTERPIVMPAKDVHESPQTAKEEYVFPPIDLLNQSGTVQDPDQRAKDEAGARKLLGTLESFGVQAKLLHVTHGRPSRGMNSRQRRA